MSEQWDSKNETHQREVAAIRREYARRFKVQLIMSSAEIYLQRKACAFDETLYQALKNLQTGTK